MFVFRGALSPRKRAWRLDGVPILRILCFCRSSAPGAMLGPSWGHLGLILGPFWGLLGSFWGCRVASWRRLGAIWRCLGASRGRPGAFPGLSGAQEPLGDAPPKMCPKRIQIGPKMCPTRTQHRPRIGSMWFQNARLSWIKCVLLSIQIHV